MGGFEVVDPRYRALSERAATVLGADPRVRSVRVGGSIGDGSADEWSDLDLQVAVAPEHHAGFVSEWPSWLAAVTPTVFARTPIAPFIVNTLTDEGLTFDVAVYAGDPPPFAPAPGYVVGQLSRAPQATLAEALDYAVAEHLRGMAGPFVSLLQREEHVRHLAGVPHLLGLLTTVFMAETGSPPPGKHWNRTYTDEQRSAIATLPAVSATRDGLVDFAMALSRLLVTRARPLFPRHGLIWPDELAAVVSRRLRDTLGLDASDWLH